MVVASVPCAPSVASAQSMSEETSVQHRLEHVYATFSTHGSYDLLHVAHQDFAPENDPGNPNLPMQLIRLLLPPDVDTETITLSMKGATENILDGTYSIAPAKPAVLDIDGKRVEDWGRTENKMIRDGKNTIVYDANTLYPAAHVELTAIGSMRGWKIAEIAYYPYRYNPVTKKLLHSLGGTLTLSWDPALKTAASSTRREQFDSVFRRELQKMTHNYTDARQRWYADRFAAMTGTSAYAATSTYTISASTSDAIAADTTAEGYYILTTETIKNSSNQLNNFITHKQSKGFTVKLFTESAWGGGSGNDAADAIRNFLMDNYAADNVKYVLLIGNPDPDIGAVPMKMCWPRSNAVTYTSYKKAPTDYYFAELSGDWDPNNNGYYGELNDFLISTFDRFPEVYVGRIPYYGNIHDLDTILNRTIRYENGEYDGNWLNTILLSAKPLDTATPMYQFCEYIKTELTGTDFVFNRVYDETYSLSPLPEFYPTNTTNVRAAWNEHAGLHLWYTHGSPESATYIITSKQVDSLDTGYPSIVFQGSCLNGLPENSDNLGYTLLKKRAIGTVSASRVGWYTPGSTHTNNDRVGGLGVNFTLKITQDALALSDALFETKIERSVTSWMNHLVFNLYGDPSLTLYTNNTHLPVAIATATPLTGEAPLTVTFDASSSYDTEGETLSFLWDCANGTYINSETGSVTYTEAGTYTLTVTVTNHSGGSAVKAFEIIVTEPKTETDAPVITVTSPHEGSEVSHDGFLFTGTVQDASAIETVGVYVYDYGSARYSVTNQAAHYDAEKNTWQYAVTSSDVTPGAKARLYVSAVDEHGNRSRWTARSITVKEKVLDTEAPTVHITAPREDTAASFDGFVFAGSVQDESDIASVTVYVYNYQTRSYTVNNAAAELSETNDSWHYTVPASALTAGAQVRLYVRATDIHTNASPWISRVVTVEEAKKPDTKPPVITVKKPLPNSTVSADTLTVAATITDEGSGVAEARLYVRDETRNMWLATNKQLAIDTETQQWTYTVTGLNDHARSTVRVYIKAVDTAGNTTGWQSFTVTVEDDIDEDLTPPAATIDELSQSADDVLTIYGTAEDTSSGIASIRIRVQTYKKDLKGNYHYWIFTDDDAAYNADTKRWKASFDARYVPRNVAKNIYLYVTDKAGNQRNLTRRLY